MPIAQMRRYADLTRDERTMRERVELLEEHDREIGRRLAELAEQREHIRGKIRYYRSLDTAGEQE
jgi:DNA-binding transcriptional MerR regulator